MLNSDEKDAIRHVFNAVWSLGGSGADRKHIIDVASSNKNVLHIINIHSPSSFVLCRCRFGGNYLLYLVVFLTVWCWDGRSVAWVYQRFVEVNWNS